MLFRAVIDATRAGALALAIALSAPSPAIAQRIDTSARGNPDGGQPFRHECAPGLYLVGLNARGGAWVDAIGAVCQRWNAATGMFDGPDQTFDVAGGTGGSPTVVRCLPNAAISGGITQRGENEDHGLAYLRVNCRRLDMPDQQFQAYAAGRAYFGEEHRAAIGHILPPLPVECPSGFWSVGIHGRSGAYVDYFGFICGKAPAAAPAVAPPPAPPRLQPGATLPSRLNTGVRSLGCPSGTEPRQDDTGKSVCVRQ